MRFMSTWYKLHFIVHGVWEWDRHLICPVSVVVQMWHIHEKNENIIYICMTWSCSSFRIDFTDTVTKTAESVLKPVLNSNVWGYTNCVWSTAGTALRTLGMELFLVDLFIFDDLSQW